VLKLRHKREPVQPVQPVLSIVPRAPTRCGDARIQWLAEAGEGGAVHVALGAPFADEVTLCARRSELLRPVTGETALRSICSTCLIELGGFRVMTGLDERE